MKPHIQCLIHRNDLDARLQYWMDRLHLNHWDIQIRICRHKEMGGDGKVGRNSYSWTHMESRISLIHPDDFDDWGEYDMEFILVHELLHLIIDVQYPVVKGRREIFSEQAINSVARSFVQMDRELVKRNEEVAEDAEKEELQKGVPGVSRETWAGQKTGCTK